MRVSLGASMGAIVCDPADPSTCYDTSTGGCNGANCVVSNLPADCIYGISADGTHCLPAPVVGNWLSNNSSLLVGIAAAISIAAFIGGRR